MGKLPAQLPGANLTIVRYNASAVKIYNAAVSIAHFSNKIIFPYCKNALAYYNADVEIEN
jgi:hypothetical protein